MSKLESSDFPIWTEIPKIFWSDLEQAPFADCLMCKRNFVEHQLVYLIEKAIRGFAGMAANTTIFEYAVCVECADEMRLQLSENSRENIESYFKESVDFKSRLEKFKSTDIKEWLKECIIHKQTVNSDGECQVYALCQGDRLIMQEFPYMIRSEALDEIMDLISNETLDMLDNFKNDLLDGPPELKELLDIGGPRVLI